jgi:hypothetical protein
MAESAATGDCCIKVLVPGGNFGVEYLAEPDVSFAVDMFSIDKPIA